MKSKRKSLIIKNSNIIYKDQNGKIVDKKTWLNISENKPYLIYDIKDLRTVNQMFTKFDLEKAQFFLLEGY